MKTLEEQQKLSKSLLAACKAAGIENPKYIMQGASRAVYHSEHDPRMHNGRYDFTQGVCIDHPPYASDWQDSLLEWVEPQKTTEHVWSNWMIEPKSEPLADVLARHQDHVADGSKMIPSGIEALVCADIAKRQQVGIAKYGKTLANNPMTLIEGLVHAYEESLDFPIYLKNNIVRLAPEFEAMQAENERAKWIMRQLINDLPRHRDWLNPDIEREMKAMAEKGGSSE